MSPSRIARNRRVSNDQATCRVRHESCLRWRSPMNVRPFVLALAAFLSGWTQIPGEEETPVTSAIVADKASSANTLTPSIPRNAHTQQQMGTLKDIGPAVSFVPGQLFNVGDLESEGKTKGQNKVDEFGPASSDMEFLDLNNPEGAVSGSGRQRINADGATSSPGLEEEPVGGGSQAQDLSPVPPGIIPPVQLDVAREESPLRVSFANGVRFRSSDDLFELNFHDETQVDGRLFSHVAPGSGRIPGSDLHDGFAVPRQRLMFVGRLTPYMDFNVSLQSGVVGTFNAINAFLDFGPGDINYRNLVRFSIGRFKTPYSYEWFMVSNWQLVCLERPLFAANFTTNREVGAMLHGVLLDGTFEYAGGVFDGRANSYRPFDNNGDFIFYLDGAPFLHSGIPFLRFMHAAGSLATGVRSNVPNEFPALRTASQGPVTTQEAAAISPTFLEFNPDVVERGLRDLWAGDFYWFYRSFNLFLEYNGGFIHYAPRLTDTKVTRVPLSGFSVTTSYFLTGEQLTKRVVPQPLHPITGKGHGYGAWEVYARFSNLNVGSEVFTAGLVDPSLWANRVNQTNTGVNWFLNKWTRITLEWQHSNFNNPVELSTNKYMNAEDLYWMRLQLFY
jgi:phosphate-selective porin OprO/OprP